MCLLLRKMKPMTGLLVSMVWIMYGVGDAAMTALMGRLVDEFGVEVMPKVLMIPLGIGLIFVLLAIRFYWKMLRLEKNVFEEAKSSNDAYCS